MRPPRGLIFTVLLCGALCAVLVKSKARKRRNLIFGNPNPRLQVVIGIGVPVDLPHEAVTTGLVAKGNYLAPYNSSMYTRPFEAFPQSRGLRSALLPDLAGLASRWQLYDTLQFILEQSAEGTGRQCLLRAVCDASAFTLHHEGLLGEFLQVFLSPSSTQDPVKHHQDYEFFAAEHAGRTARAAADPITTCQQLFSGCATTPLDVFTTILASAHFT